MPPRKRIIPPPEIITQILYRLPAKSIGRFRCVSKGWLSLLTDPEFIKTHRNTTLNRNHLIFESPVYTSRPAAKVSTFLLSHPFHYTEAVITPTKCNLELNYHDYLYVECLCIFGSCHGLVLVCAILDDGSEMPLLVNPTTRESLQLPQDYCNLDEIHFADIETETMYGFGYDSVTDDYKVVTLNYFSCSTYDEVDVEGVYVYVYSLRNKTWTRVIDSPYYKYDQTDGVFVSGFIHWIASKGRSHEDLRVIVAFSLAGECFTEVSSPKLYNITKMFNTYDCKLLVLGGKLAIFIRSKGEVWLMNEYGVRESWTKILLYEINKISIRERIHYTKPLFLDENGKILVANNWMTVYEVEKGTSSETVLVCNPKDLPVVGTYVESLVSPKLSITKQKSTSSSQEMKLIGLLSMEKTKKKKKKKKKKKAKVVGTSKQAVGQSFEAFAMQSFAITPGQSPIVDKAGTTFGTTSCNQPMQAELKSPVSTHTSFHEPHQQVNISSEETRKDDADTWEGIRADLEFSGVESTHPERQTGKRKDIGCSNAPSKSRLVYSSPGPVGMPEPSSRELLDPELIRHRLEGVVPLHLAQEDLGISIGDLCHRADTDFFNSLCSFEAIRRNLQATGHVVDTLSRDIKEKNVIILDLERKVSQGYDSWKAKHREEKLRADRLEGELTHALSKQQFLTLRLEENEAFERRTRELEHTIVEKQEELLEKGRALDTANAEIECLKARLALA